jgi:hypothetical protein
VESLPAHAAVNARMPKLIEMNDRDMRSREWLNGLSDGD